MSPQLQPSDYLQVVELSATTVPTSLPTVSAQPTSLVDSSPRTMGPHEASCFSEGCTVDVAFDTSRFAGSIAHAALTISLAGDLGSPMKMAEITVNGAAGGCGTESYFSFCGQSRTCSSFDAADVTTAARTGHVLVAATASRYVQPVCTDAHALRLTATLVVEFGATAHPTPMPSPPVPTTLVHATHDDLQRALGRAATTGSSADIQVQGVIVFDHPLVIDSEGRHRISGVDTENGATILDGDSSTRLFRVANADLTLSDLALERGLGWFGGCVQAVNSTVELVRVIFRDCNADFGGGVFLEASTLLVTESELRSNAATFDGGGVLASRGSTILADASTFTLHAAGENGGVFFVEDSSSFTATHSIFANNTAFWGGVARVEESSFTATGSLFERNGAGALGGVAFVGYSSIFATTNSSFVSNNATRFAGVVFVGISGSSSIFRATNASFTANVAGIGANILQLGFASTAELYGVTIQDDDPGVHTFRCFGTGTIYLAQWRVLDDDWFAAQRLDLDGSCVVFIYQVNDDGSLEDELKAAIDDRGAIQLVYWSYPCGPGRWSSDGIEHGNTTEYADSNGRTIDENDPFCTRDDALCAASCQTCPAGTYSEFTVDRFRLVGEASCSACPVGRYLEDDGSSGRWWLHDGPDDCAACPPGRYSDGTGSSTCLVCSPGSFANETSGGAIFCDVAEPGYVVAAAEASEQEPCSPGSFSVGGTDAVSCQKCTLGRFQPDSAQTLCLLASPGFFVGVLGSTNETLCPAGRFSGTGQSECTRCSIGSFQPATGRTACLLAEPGFAVETEGRTDQTICPAGHFSGTGQSECTPCPPRTFNDREGQSACKLAPAGTVVNTTGAIGAEDCPKGTFSGVASTQCEPCPIGTYNNETGEGECRRCPIPTTTSAPGLEFCDACERTYYWDTVYFERRGRDEVRDGEQCVDCCVQCEDACDVEGKDCIENCDAEDLARGPELETLDVRRGRWRATKTAGTIYDCPMRRSCRGGVSTKTADQCFDGHHGALCGACMKGFDFDLARNRCVKCRGTRTMLSRAGNVLIAAILIGVLTYVWLRRYGKSHHLTAAILAVKESVRAGFSMGSQSTMFDDMGATFAAGAADDERDDEGTTDDDARRAGTVRTATAETSARRKKAIHKSILTKLKIVVAAWQIAQSTEFVLPQVRFPRVFGEVRDAMNFLGIALLDVGAFDCLVGWSFMSRMVVVTIAPFVVTGLIAGAYLVIRWRRATIETAADRHEAFSNVVYAILLLVYVILPSVSTVVITFFSCRKFDRGDGVDDLKVMAFELSIDCRGQRHKRWRAFAACMILVWPVGMPLAIVALLWRNRARLNPPLSARVAAQIHRRRTSVKVPEVFQSAQRNYATALEQAAKIEIRDADDSIAALAFVFEEYEPRSYMFPVFEIVRRLFLSSVLAVFFPGSMQQVCVGLLGTMLSFAVYSSEQAYIEDDDDKVSSVAQAQLVLIYFAALAVFTSDESDQKQGVFSSVAFVVVLIGVFFASFIVAIYVILLDVFGHASLREAYEKARSGRSVPRPSRPSEGLPETSTPDNARPTPQRADSTSGAPPASPRSVGEESAGLDEDIVYVDDDDDETTPKEQGTVDDEDDDDEEPV